MNHTNYKISYKQEELNLNRYESNNIDKVNTKTELDGFKDELNDLNTYYIN
jgi:hypothetical protein